MAKPIISISTISGFKVVKFEIPGGVTTPGEAALAVSEIEKEVSGSLPVLLNGRGPVWLYAMLAHTAHPTPAVATFDPRLGYVVVASHDERWRVGDAIPDPEAKG